MYKKFSYSKPTQVQNSTYEKTELGRNGTITIWNQPLGGSCPCTLNAIGLLSHEVTGLVAGQDFTFYMQLTSAYGKKGPVTSFMVATYTDLKVYIWNEPSEGSCPCLLDNSSPNNVTITNLIAGGEYKIHMLAESEFGRNSSQLSFVRSLYTDDVTVTNVVNTHSLQTEVQFDSGVGSTVEIELECLDLPLSWRQKEVFELNLAFSFDIVPGSSYAWTIIATNRGSNPLQRNYTFSDTNPPMSPISLVEAASTLETYDTFVLTIGSEHFVDGSTKVIQFKWAQERRVDGYNITDKTLDRHLSHVISDSGWSLHDSVQLTAGKQYTYEIRSVSHGLYSSNVMTIEGSPHPLPPNENSTLRVVGARDITMTLEYFDVVEYLIVTLVPPEGNCGSGCIFDAPSTSSVQVNGLTPGRGYNISLSTESYGKKSEPLIIQEQLEPGQITHFLLVVSTNKITVEIQLESEAGSGITLEYIGIYTGHTGSQDYPYKMIMKLNDKRLIPIKELSEAVPLNDIESEFANPGANLWVSLNKLKANNSQKRLEEAKSRE
ncbi:uncharacterized protein LOC142338020 [Convolutriloba macropyga]|uniref:uncharacterized protein LOC142338020 n=1 Tax=Convolutriloba macropyga TaxID=536237 RepID=UPI003F528CFE